jgi:hypothetical protein
VQPDSLEQLAAIGRLHALFATHGAAYWLFGGWAVDFHVGRITRDHADIDIAVWWDDRSHVAALLAGDGWAHTPEAEEDGYTCYERVGVRLEVAFLARDGEHIYTPLREGRGEWPDDTFGDDVRELSGVRARMIRRAALVADKATVRADSVTAAKDAADAQVLRAPSAAADGRTR